MNAGDLLKLGCALGVLVPAAFGAEVVVEAPRSVPRFDVAEIVVKVERPPFENPFTEARLEGELAAEGIAPVRVEGFADSPDGSTFRLRFCPDRAGVTYRYALRLEGGGLKEEISGKLLCEPSDRPGPVAVDPARPRHFLRAGSRKPFYHLGYTAYHLLDPTNDLEKIDETIEYCRELGFNKVRFLLTGYPRDLDRRASRDVEHGSDRGDPDPWKAPNYGSLPGQVNPLPAWEGKPHVYDFTRFNVEHWRRADHAVRRMRERGIVATCIFTIEKQDLPKELGRLSEHEIRLYRYAVARLAAFDNVWWDLGNEHNEFRDVEWGNAMGKLLKDADPYDRLASAHGYAEFLYPESAWADFIVTQQYGDEAAVHGWALRHRALSKPYVNEEYGYEGRGDKPGHGQSAGWVRRCHWAIAMAGGYATYGDWSGGVSYFYMGEPGPGKAAGQLRHLRAFFEALPFADMEPRDELTSEGFCLASPSGHMVLYLPRGGGAEVDLAAAGKGPCRSRWHDPRTGEWRDGPDLEAGKRRVAAPGPEGEDWVLLVTAEGRG